MVAGDSSGWLPPGWIEQDKVRHGQNVKLYCNVKTGQRFYSKKDVLRYVRMVNVSGGTLQPIEMGNVSHDTPQPVRNKMRSKKKSTPSQSAVHKKKSRRKITGKQLFAGTGSSEAPEAENLEEKHSLDNMSEKCSETNEIPVPKTKGSKRKRGNNVSAENGMVKHSNKKTQNKKELSVPDRSSRRLKGIKPEMMTNLGLSERALRAAARMGDEIESDPYWGLNPRALEDQAQNYEMAESQNAQLLNPCMETLLDPCLKTLTGNVSLPGCSSVGPQQSSLNGGNKEY